MSIIEVMVEARKLIEDPSRWTQNTYARNSEGEPVEAHAIDAYKFCSVGALRHVASLDKMLEPSVFLLQVRTALDRVAQSMGATGMIGLNDKSTHHDVLMMFDRAIELERVTNDQEKAQSCN